MKKIFDWIKNHTADILIVLGAISALLVNLQSQGIVTVWIPITIAIIAVIIEVLKYGISEKAIKLITEAVLIILEALRNKDENEAVGVAKVDVEARLREAIKK